VELMAAAADVRAALDRARAAGSVVGFVPTMGALHEGHASLLRRARSETATVVLSIFVNPLQFAADEDLGRYPRTPANDLGVAEREGCDLVFAPREDDMYPLGPPEVSIDPGPLGEVLEGKVRPGHFRGVLTVVAKLLGVAGPCRAYFGEKDAQQLALIRRMARDLDVPVDVVGCPTVRDRDGLALSSRNAYLSEDERRRAVALVRALAIAGNLVREGERRAERLEAEMARRILAESPDELDYAAVVDEATWRRPETVGRPCRAVVAARFGTTRLIDNLLLPWDAGTGAR
jgi:pantoate--beta-alanine ligase